MTNRREFLQLSTAGVAGAAAIGMAPEAGAAAPKYVVPPSPNPSLPIVGSSARFPVRRIYCMGLNYQKHVDEGRGGFKAPPFFFFKTADQIVQNGGTIPYPLLTKEFAYEVELVLALKRGGANIPAEKALDCIYGYATGLDMTRRDLQGAALEKKLPWEPGKSFDHSAPCSAITPVSKIGHLKDARLTLSVNGTLHQDGNTADMILNVPAIIAFLSTYCELMPGDLIYTGTPAGSSSVVSGDKMVGTIDKLETLRINVA